jgi:hypothetical protein
VEVVAGSAVLMGMAGAIAGLAFGMVLRTFTFIELTFILLLFPANGSIRFAGGLGDRSLPS